MQARGTSVEALLLLVCLATGERVSCCQHSVACTKIPAGLGSAVRWFPVGQNK